MPSCNLAESIHNKWLQPYGNSGGDLYVATVDDFVRAFLQVVNYYQFLKDDVGGTCPIKKELKLRMAERRTQITTSTSKSPRPLHNGHSLPTLEAPPAELPPEIKNPPIHQLYVILSRTKHYQNLVDAISTSTRIALMPCFSPKCSCLRPCLPLFALGHALALVPFVVWPPNFGETLK